MAMMYGLDEQPEDMDRRALRDQMRTKRAAPRAEGDVPGSMDTPESNAARRRAEAPGLGAPAGDAPAAPDYSQFGSFGHGSLNQDKIAAGHDSPKYQIARVLSHFDPSKGITPEALEALNSLGIGTFSGQNDKLFVGGEMDPRFKGVTGSDIVRGFKTGQGTWGGWGSVDPSGPGVQPQAARMPSGMMAPGGMSSSMRALAPTDRGTYDQLQQRLMELLGGEQTFDREALIAQMSR